MMELVPLQMADAITTMIGNFDFFVVMNILLLFAVGAFWGKSFAVGSLAGYTGFIYIAITVDVPLYTNILYVTATLAAVGMGFKLYRMEGPGR